MDAREEEGEEDEEGEEEEGEELVLSGMRAEMRNLISGRRECGKRVESTASHSRVPECTHICRRIETLSQY